MPNLFAIGETFILQGYSIIPLVADGKHAKQAALPWSDFQQRRATLGELQQWEAAGMLQALGIVTGRVSGLVVIDLDNTERLEQFKKRFATLYQTTMRVVTRRGEHVYFAIKANLPTVRGADCGFHANGAYVVAPYSVVNGHTYKRVGQGVPRQITINEAAELSAWVKTTGQSPPVDAAAMAAAAVPAAPYFYSEADVLGFYHRTVGLGIGRNAALFAAGIAARDSGRDLPWALSVLQDAHITEPGNQAHRSETPAKRQREAVATLRSAYSRPPRHPRDKAPNLGLPNIAREALNRRGSTRGALLLDVLRALGIAPGMRFSYTTIREIADDYLSDHVTRYGLQDLIALGVLHEDSTNLPASPAETNLSKINSTGDNPNGNPPNNPLTLLRSVAIADNKLSETIANSLARQKRQNLETRPQTYYTMPSNSAINRALGLQNAIVSDDMPLDDMTSPKAYRMAMEREFIKRRPGKHKPSFLTGRLGICQKTLQRYHRDIPIHSEPLYNDVTITWQNVDILPVERVLGASFLLIGEKRYPLIRAIAIRALQRGQMVTRRTQTHSYYWYGSIRPPAVASNRSDWISDYTAETRPSPAAPQLILNKPASQTAIRNSTLSQLSEAPATPKPKRDRSTQRAYQTDARRYKKPLASERRENLAQQAYQVVNELAPKTLSLAMCRRVAQTCPPKRVERALDLLKTQEIHNPAAYFNTVSGYHIFAYRKAQMAKINQFSEKV